MTVTDHPLRSNKKRVDASAWQGLLAEATLPRDPSLAVNPFKPPSLHPPSVHGADAMAQDEAFSEAGSWAFSALESAIRGGFYTMAFLGFPALANLSQKAEYRRMVEIISTEMTRKWIKITVSSETDKGDAVKKIEQAMHQFRVRELFRKAAEHDGFFGRGHIFIDTGAPDDIELATSIGAGGDDVSRAKVGVNRLRSLRVIEPVWCSPAEYNATNPLDANFYVPTAWYVQNKRIHASRLLTFVSRPVSDLLKPAYAFGGIPLIQLAQEYVDNWDRVRSSIGRLVESFSIIGLKTKLAEALNNGMSSDDMIRRLRLFTEFRKNQGTFIIDADEDFFNVNIPLGGLDELQAQAQEHMCLRKGTFIETDRGQVPIEKVTVSDKVMTRNGYAPVVWSGITKYVSRLVEIETKASSLFMTEEHPVWSETAGAFVSARTVDPSDRLRRSLAWDATANQSLGVVGSGVGRKLAISGIRKLAGSCTASFMRFMSDLSRRASTFITSMATDLITSFPTFASCLVANTMPNTSHEGSIRALGTSSARNARSAASPTLPLGPTGLDSVGLPASRGNGKDASVVAARAFDCEPEPVYDITVADGHLPEFYANGILVHNSTVAGIPLVKFFGLSPHGLNATSEPEIRVFYDWIASLQESFFRGPLTSVLNFLQLNIAGEIDPDIGFTFEPLWTASEAEQAQVRSTNAQTDKSYIDGNVLSPLEVRKKVANDKEMPYSGLELDDTPELSDAQLSENATKMATPTLQAFSDGLIDASQALAELVEAGLFKTITPEDVANAKAQQEVPEPPGPGGDPSAEGGGGGGGAPPPNGPPQSPRPSGGPPNLRLASASDESKRFDLGHLTKIESERLRQALRTGDLETVREILAEREAYRGAWDDVGSFVAYHGTPFDFDHFDESHIGTGTARAHYGRGIYLASKPEVARRYLNELTDRLQLSGKPIHRLNAAETHITGHLYTVRVMRPRTAFFPWEMLGLPDKSGLSDELQHRLEREGYEGIVYRDPILRGELNYVVFDPKNIEVLKQDDRLIAQDDGPKGEPRNDHGEWTEGGGSHVTMRQSGQNIGSEEVKKLTRPGHFYRGMEPAEFHATVGRGAGVKSRGDYSTRNEGTVFSHEADTAESYANYGSSDPRKTGRTNYLVEIRDHGDMKQDRDGYYKTQTEVPAANITRVWSMEPQGGAIIGKPLVRRRQDDRLIAADRDVSEEKRDHGKWTAGAAVGADPKAPKEQRAGEEAVDPDAERISTRVPTAKAKKGQTLTDPHSTSEFTSDYESAKADPASFAKNVATIRDMPGMAATKNMSDDQTAEYFIDHVKNNVLALWNAVPDAIKSRSKLWYDGANRMAHEWSEHFGVEPRAAAACIAALSPRKDWFQNMSLAHRVLDTIKNHGQEKFTQRMAERLEEYATAKERGSGNPGNKTHVKPNPEAAAYVRKMAQSLKGKSLNELTDPMERAYFVRFLDETENTRAYQVYSPEGDVLGAKQKKEGGDARVVWQSFDNIAKAISVIDDPSPANISQQLGGNHKVRNFYNNIIAPKSLAGDVTIDTHAIGAGNLMPWSSADKEVNVGLGTGGSGSAKTGMKGLYALYAEGYRRAAKSEKVLPREMQSVTWEAQRGLFPDDDKNTNLTKQIKGVWDDVDRGKLSREDARKQILSRGIKPPDWYESARSEHGQTRGAADARELYRAELGQSGGRGRERAAGNIPILSLDEFGQWEEDKHPREQHGRFTSGAGVARKVSQGPAPHHPHVEFQPVDPRERPPAQLSWESAPGKTTRSMPQFHDAPLEQRREYQKAVEKVLSDEKGHDVIAQTLGLRTGPTFSAAGVFQGRVNPGAQSQVNLGRLTDEDKAKINASEAIRGILLRQDAGAWHRPEPPPGHAYLIPGLKTAKGAVFPQDTGRGLTHKDALQALTPEDQKAFLASGSQNDANYVFKNDKGQILSRVAARQYAEQNGLLSDIGKGYKQPKLISEHLDPHASTRFVDIDPQESNMLDFRMGRTPSEGEAGAVDKALSSVSGLDYALVPTQQGWRVLNTGSMPNDEFGAAVHQAIEGLESDTLPDQIRAQRAHYVGDYLANDWSRSPHAEDYLRAIGQAGPDVQRSADTILAQLGPKIAGVEDDFSKRYGWTPDASTRIWNKGPAQDLLARNGGAPHEGQVQDAADKILAKHGVADVVKSVRDKIAAGVPTNAHVKDGGHTLDDGSYTPERRQLHKDIINKLFTPEAVQAASPAPGTRPTMTILGGRGGSGKSWITGDDGPVSRKNTLVIDSDHFKQQLPEYQGWNAGLLHEESSYIADRAAEIAKQRGLNVAFDQTMKSGSSAPKRLDQFADTHDLQGYYVHATPEVAADRAMGRFAKGGTSGDKTGRFVPPEYILGSHNNEANFDAIVPRLKKWGLYDNNGEKGAPKKVAEGKNDPSH